MLDQEKLFKYFKPGYIIKLYDDGILVYYYLQYLHENENYHICAMYIEEYHNLETGEISYNNTNNYLRYEIGFDDLINYIQKTAELGFEEKFNQVCEEYQKLTLQRQLKKFTKDLQNVSDTIIAKTEGQLLEGSLIKLEYHFNYSRMDNVIYLSLKIGNSKYYVVKNIGEFFRAIRRNEIVSYGKQLSFVHRFDNFIPEDQKNLEILSAVPFHYYNSREIALQPTTFDLLLENIKGRFVYFSDTPYLVRLQKVDVEISVDKDYLLHTTLTKDVNLLSTNKTSYIMDKKNHIIDVVNCSTQDNDLFHFAHQYEGINLKPVLKEFKNHFFMHYQENIKIAPEITNDFKVNLIDIEAYFDYVDGTITVNTILKKKDKVLEKEELKNHFDLKKYNQYVTYLSNIGFEDNVLTKEDAIYRFLTMDFTYLKKICKVYLSDNIANKQIVKFKTPSLKVDYQNNLLSFLLENSKFSDDELYQILKAIRKKQKFFVLDKNTIVDLNNDDATTFEELVEDLKLNEKSLTKKIEKPLYQSFKLQNYQTDITLDDHVLKIINDIANFKNANEPLPNVLATLRPYQIEGFNWLKILSRYGLGGILADDMGLGKTLEIITLLKSDDTKMPSLIVCPKSLIFNWHAEFEKFDPDTKIKEIYGLPNERKAIIDQIQTNEKVIYITSYDSLRNDEELKEVQFNYLIIDEGQYIKNVKAKKTQSVKSLNAFHKFALTGTPIENNVYDLWSLFDYIMPDYLPPVSSFKDATNDDSYLEKLAKKIAPFILRRTKQEVLTDLPSKFERVITAELTVEQNKIYDAYVLKAKDALNSDNKLIAFLSIITRLRQICVDPKTFIDNYEGTSGKIETLMEIVNEYIANNHRILIFSQFVSALEIIEQKMQANKINYYKLTGQTKAKDRIDLANRFNNDENIKVFLISLKAGGTGLNLIGADTIIHLDPWWNVASENQATDRTHRIGQTKNVEVIKLICRNTIEQRVIELQNLKKDLIDKLISDDDSSITKLSKEDLNFILG